MTETTSRQTRARRLATRHYLRQVWRQRARSVPGLLLPGLGTVLHSYVPPLVVGRLLQRYAGGEAPTGDELVPYVAAFAAAWLAGEICWRLGIHLLIRTECDGIADLSVTGMDQLFAKDLSFFHDNFAGSLTKRVVGYASRFEDFVDTLVFGVVSKVAPIAFAVPVLWLFSPWLVLILLGMLAATAAAVLPLIRRRRTLVDAREEASATLAGHVADVLANMDAVRALAREDVEAEIHRRNVDRLRLRQRRSWDYHNLRIDVVTAPMQLATMLLGLLVSLSIGSDGRLDVEAVFVTFTYFVTSTQIVWEFNDVYRSIESSLAEASQFCELLLDEPEVVDPPDPQPLDPHDAGVRFEHVTFRHPGAAGPLFDDLVLEVASGERVGLVGRSGGGKTTLTKLLLRFMDVDGGRILVGGQDTSRLRQADLRSLIAYVPQEPVMFHRSLADNIRAGRTDARDAEVEAAARAARAAEFVEALPDGYATLVGERGVKLSGGQRQRVAIARALLRRAPILVLDEATSSLDSESEALIQEALLAVMEGRTTIVVAHRLSTVQRMDRLVVLDQGRIVEEGTHHQLLARRGAYHDLWHRQSGGFLGDADGDDRPHRPVHVPTDRPSAVDAV